MITNHERNTMQTNTSDDGNCAVDNNEGKLAVTMSQVDQVKRSSKYGNMHSENTVVEPLRRHGNDVTTSPHGNDSIQIMHKSAKEWDQKLMDLESVKKGCEDDNSGNTVRGTVCPSNMKVFIPNTTSSLSGDKSTEGSSAQMDSGAASSSNTRAIVTNTGASSSGDDRSNSRSFNSNSAGKVIFCNHHARYSQNYNRQKAAGNKELETLHDQLESDTNHPLHHGVSTTTTEMSLTHQDIELIAKPRTSESYQNCNLHSTRRKLLSSDSGSDSGYVGSNSSNDAFGTSSSSSDSSRKHKSCKRKYDNTLSEQQRTSDSSDLADFSTGSNESSNAGSPFAPLSEDSECSLVQQKPRRIYETRVPSPIVFHNHFKQSDPTKMDKHMIESDIMSNPSQFPDNWTFFQGRAKRKVHPSENRCKEIFEKNCRELNENFQSAVKRIRPLPKKSSESSVESSLTSASADVSAKASETVSTYPTTPLYDLGVDAMAKVLSYLHPIEVYRFASMPLSKSFKTTYSQPQDLWKILCLAEPFYAKAEKTNGQEDDESISSYPICKSLELKHIIGRYRLLYSSFIKCVRYLDRIKEDAKAGKVPAAVYSGSNEEAVSFGENSSLKRFFAKARELKNKNETDSDEMISNDNGSMETEDAGGQDQKETALVALTARKVRISEEISHYITLLLMSLFIYDL